ncbi:uncharacterized protein LOC127750990 [Frankliniella occidentalis]|uniref:Uncharacterized protein LOC127750990 n=1 Tax=Frankliniella occidentalis TaxID=133901 RepID=A0A9C6X606_FRAOC|nr:uncharacterized protein LOC127750990 [Frankliniella occidentalis]
MTVILDVWANNRWKENAFILNFKNKACTNFKNNSPSFFEHLFKKIKGPCIIRPGVYELKDAPVKWEYPNIPIMPYGRYKFKVTGGKTAEPLLCLVVDVRTIPKVD